MPKTRATAKAATHPSIPNPVPRINSITRLTTGAPLWANGAASFSATSGTPRASANRPGPSCDWQPNQAIEWGYRGKHGKDITSGISADDIRWLLTYLAGVTDEDLRAGLQASGASNSAIDVYTRCLRERIAQLQRVSALPASRAAAGARPLR